MRRSLLPVLVIQLLMIAGCSEPVEPPSSGPDDASTSSRAPTDAGGSPPGPEGQPAIDAPEGPVAERTGAVPFDKEGGCTEEYDATAVADRGFALDGTVTAIGNDGVTLEVHEWLVGDGSATATVRMGPPTQSGMSESPPSYSVGTRLLVSGEGEIAWACGFTRYYDTETAAAWRS